jgi:HECT-domain (ubiquitin-transferase)
MLPTGMDLLPCLLTYFTSMDQVPPLGFNPEPRLEFRDPVDIPIDDSTRNYPLANTCMNILTLLPVLKTYDEFYTNIVAVIQTVTTFTKM